MRTNHDQVLTTVLHNVAESTEMPLDEGDPHQVTPTAAAAAAPAARAAASRAAPWLDETSESEVDLPPSPVRYTLPAQPKDRGRWLLPPPRRSLASRNSANPSFANIREHQRRFCPPGFVYLAALPVAEPLPDAAGQRWVEGIGAVRHAC